MNDTFFLNGGALLWGALLGLIYFGGLWLTIRRLPIVRHQALWLVSSLMVRNLLVAAGFYPVVIHGWQPALFCLTGIIIIRFILTRRIKLIKTWR